MSVDDSEIEKWEQEGRYTSLFISQIHRLRRLSFSDPELKQQLVQALIYAECLIKLASLKGAALRKPALPDDYPLPIRQKVVERFMSGGLGKQKYLNIF